MGCRYLDVKEEGQYVDKRLGGLSRSITAGYSDVYRTHFEDEPGDDIAVKILKYTVDNAVVNALMDSALKKEITVLQRIRHPNILPFIGLVTYRNDPCIVTPWMKNGSLRQYLHTHPDTDRLEILRDAATALEYLHGGAGLPETSSVIHGDIHAGNVLISDKGTALLADFGLSKLVPLNEQASLSLRHGGKAQGNSWYMAPELQAPNALRSLRSDVFAFGMLIYETYAGVGPNVPAHELQSGQRPKRTSISRNDMTDAVWQTACACWTHTPSDRPSMQDVSQLLRRARRPNLTPVANHAATESVCDGPPIQSAERKGHDEVDRELYLQEHIDIPTRPLTVTRESEVYRASYTGRPSDEVAVRRMRYTCSDPGRMRFMVENNTAGLESVQDPRTIGGHTCSMLCTENGECLSERPEATPGECVGFLDRVACAIVCFGENTFPGFIRKGLSLLHTSRNLLRGSTTPPLQGETVSDRSGPTSRLLCDLTQFINIGRDVPFAISSYSDLYRVTILENIPAVVRRIRFQDDQAAREPMLRNAAAVLVTARHVNVLNYIGTCELEGRLSIVSAFAGGGNLKKHIAGHPDCDRRTLLMQVARGILYLHQSGIIHGNLHPRNVLLSEDGTVKISDFGLADIIPDEGTMSMRPAFAREKAMHRAPETHMGHSLTPTSDVYSFAMLAFHAYSHKEPMIERYPGAKHVVAALMSGERPLRVEIARSDFSDNLWSTVQWCWTTEKEKRPPMSAVVDCIRKDMSPTS